MGQLRSISPVLLVVAAVFLTNVANGDPTGPESPPAEVTVPRGLTPTETQALRVGNEFGLKLLRWLYAARDDKRANVFISPLSASMSLGMMLNGAGGETFQAMGNTLGLTGLSVAGTNAAYKALVEFLVQLDPSVEFRVANNSWLEGDFRIRRDYWDRLREAFDTQIEYVNFDQPDMAGSGSARSGTISQFARPWK